MHAKYSVTDSPALAMQNHAWTTSPDQHGHPLAVTSSWEDTVYVSSKTAWSPKLLESEQPSLYLDHYCLIGLFDYLLSPGR